MWQWQDLLQAIVCNADAQMRCAMHVIKLKMKVHQQNRSMAPDSTASAGWVKAAGNGRQAHQAQPLTVRPEALLILDLLVQPAGRGGQVVTC